MNKAYNSGLQLLMHAIYPVSLLYLINKCIQTVHSLNLSYFKVHKYPFSIIQSQQFTGLISLLTADYLVNQTTASYKAGSPEQWIQSQATA
jgi:hypothetical protein